VTRVHKADIPAEQPEAQAAPRFPHAHGDQERPEGAGSPPRQGPQETQRVGSSNSQVNESSQANQRTGAVAPPEGVRIERLRVRREFLYVAQGPAERRRTVVVQARLRKPSRPAAGAGFTSTKKIGGAVVRNRARRRLREAVRALLPGLGVAGADYVFIARLDTAECPWGRLLDDVESALVSLRARLLVGEDSNPASRERPRRPSPARPPARPKA
jgi:ribonuclease P protein component